MIPKLFQEAMQTAMASAEDNPITEDKIGGDVDDSFSERILTGGFQGVAVQLGYLRPISFIRLGSETGPALLIIGNLG